MIERTEQIPLSPEDEERAKVLLRAIARINAPQVEPPEPENPDTVVKGQIVNLLVKIRQQERGER